MWGHKTGSTLRDFHDYLLLPIQIGLLSKLHQEEVETKAKEKKLLSLPKTTTRCCSRVLIYLFHTMGRSFPAPSTSLNHVR